MNRALPSFDEGLLEITLIVILNNPLNWKNFFLKFKILKCTLYSLECLVYSVIIREDARERTLQNYISNKDTYNMYSVYSMYCTITSLIVMYNHYLRSISQQFSFGHKES